MTKVKARQRAKANSLLKAARKKASAKQAKVNMPAGQFDTGSGEIRSAYHAGGASAGKFAGAKATSSH